MIIPILTSLLGFVGVGGLATIALSSFGVGVPIVGGIVAWFVAKNIPWKLIVICAAAAFIGLIVFAGYETFATTQSDLVKARAEAAQEKDRANAEKARADNYVVQHDAQIIRIDALEKARTQVEEHAAELQTQINDMTLEEDFNNDTAKAILTLNARNRELNRLLISASRAGGAGRTKAVAGNSAGKAKPAAPIQ